MIPASKGTPRRAHNHFLRQGFTRYELLTGLALIALLAIIGRFFYHEFYSRKGGALNARQAATQAKVIHGWLTTYALDHGGNFPPGATANEAYRELFKAGTGADEKQFSIPGDAYHKSAPMEGPDGEIGSSPDYARALEPGENAFAYVSGLTDKDISRIPLIANGFTSRPGVWSKNHDERGGVFRGRYGVVCRVGGSAVSHVLREGEWMVIEKDGAPMNIFTSGFEGTKFTVVAPE